MPENTQPEQPPSAGENAEAAEIAAAKKKKEEEEKKEKLKYIILIEHDGSQFVKKYVEVGKPKNTDINLIIKFQNNNKTIQEDYDNKKQFKFYLDNQSYVLVIFKEKIVDHNIARKYKKNKTSGSPSETITLESTKYSIVKCRINDTLYDIKPANAEINLILKNIFDTNRFFKSSDDDSSLDLDKLKNLLIIFNHKQNSNDSDVICYKLEESNTSPFTVISVNGSIVKSDNNNLIELSDDDKKVYVMFVSNMYIEKVQDSKNAELTPKSDDGFKQDEIKQYLYKYFNIGKVNKMLRA
jgi:hypothetical protein